MSRLRLISREINPGQIGGPSEATMFSLQIYGRDW